MAVEPTQTILTCNAEFVDLALREVHSAVPGSQQSREIAAGVLLLNAPFEAIAAAWRTEPPIFVRHICPAQVQLDLPEENAEAWLSLLQKAHLEAIAPHLAPRVPFSIQTRLLVEHPLLKPFDINNALAALVKNAPLEVRQPQQIVSVVIGRVEGALRAWLGLSMAADNLSDWAGGARRFANEDSRISRSEFKLLEALEVFRIALPVRGYALDLGAAPGGWTHVLRQQGMYVTAVDPAALDSRLLRDTGVRHKRMTAEAYLRKNVDVFDVIVNDMRMDGRDSARLLVAYAQWLRRGSPAIMTLKLPNSGRLSLIEQACAILEDAYHVMAARQLFHNRSEITLHLKRR